MNSSVELRRWVRDSGLVFALGACLGIPNRLLGGGPILWATEGAGGSHGFSEERRGHVAMAGSLRVRFLERWAAHLSDGDGFGAAATAEMRANTQNIAAIFDFFDDTSLVRVNYSGFLSSPVPGTGPDW